MRSFKRSIIVFILGFCAIFVQGTVMKSFAPTSLIVPNIMLIVVAYLAFHEATVLGSFLSFLLGVQFDISSGVLLGPWAASCVVVFALLSLTSQHVFVESPFAVGVAVLFSSLTASGVYLVIVGQFERTQTSPISLSVWMIMEALFTAVLAPPLFRVLRRVMR